MMKKVLFTSIVILVAGVAEAQMWIRTTPTDLPASERGGFRIGPRYSNYATDVDLGDFGVESGRQHAFGFVGEFRSGAFVLDFNFDHDPQDGIQVTDFLPIEFGGYERDRIEFTVGWSPLSVLDIQGGFRTDSFSIGGAAFGGGLFAADEFEHSAIVGGLHVHTPTRRPFGLYGTARAFVGSIDFGGRGVAAQDSAGVKFEGGVEIPIGDSRWHAVPGIEVERLISDPLITIETNRFFVNFVYSFQR